MNKKATLKDCQLYKKEDKYYLSLTYEVEELDGIYEYNIPKVSLPIATDRILIEETTIGTYSHHCGRLFDDIENICNLVLDNHARLKLEKDNEILYSSRLIKKKTRKMTLAEIEKELGYKVEVVSKK